MTKIRIPVDMDMGAFEAFLSKFQGYAAALKDMPGAWGKIAQETERAASGSVALADGARELEGALQGAQAASTRVRRESEATAHAWARLERASRGAAGNIKEATVALLKWSGIASIVGGLAGTAGIMGMDALGSHVSQGRTAAMRAGTTYGGREAFTINFGRFGDAEGVLGRVSGIMSSADRTALRNLGISEKEIREGDPADIAAKAFENLRERAKKVDPKFLGDWLRSNRIDEIFDLGQALQARNMSDDEMREIQGRYRKDRPGLEMTPQAQLGWTRFSMQLDFAAALIKKTFAENLAKLTKGLGALSEALSKALAALFRKDGPIAHFLESIGKWLEKFSDDISSPEFQARLKGLFDGVKTLVEWTGAFLSGLAKVGRWFGITPAAAATSGFGNGAGGKAGDGAGGSSGEAAPDAGGQANAPKGDEKARGLALMRRLVEKHGWTPEAAAIAAGNAKQESNVRSDGPAGDRGTAHGLFQWRGDRFAALQAFARARGTSWRDFDTQVDFFAKEAVERRGTRDWPRVRDFSDAGRIGWDFERYGDNSTGTRVRNARGFYEAFKRGGDATADQAAPRPIDAIPPSWRTKVLIRRPPGGDLAQTAAAAAAHTP
ncbi:MAG: phage tail tip lysozyme [Methylocystis sp.]|nr:phage tail tip lysozyme [Methylocystis sp.]